MTLQQLVEQRLRWVNAARIYYLSPGDDSGMSDHEWDAIGKELYARRKELPGCPILNDNFYEGGSLYWVRTSLYEKALAADPLGPVQLELDFESDAPLVCSRDQSGDTTCEACQ